MSYYTSIRHASPRSIRHMTAPSSAYQKKLRRVPSANLNRLIKEENTRTKYLWLHEADKRAKEHANFIARNGKINSVRNAINRYQRTLARNLPNYHINLQPFFPQPKIILRKTIYYLKQHLKRLEFAKFLAGRKVAEFMMPKAKAHFMSLR